MCSREPARRSRSSRPTIKHRVDRLIQAVAWAVANRSSFHRLVKMGIEESGLGDFDSRMNKRMKIRGVLRDALRSPSVGIIEEDLEKGLVKYGKPVGMIGCVVPTTNPDLTPAGNAIYAIKARDVVVFSPHPRSSTRPSRPSASCAKRWRRRALPPTSCSASPCRASRRRRRSCAAPTSSSPPAARGSCARRTVPARPRTAWAPATRRSSSMRPPTSRRRRATACCRRPRTSAPGARRTETSWFLRAGTRRCSTRSRPRAATSRRRISGRRCRR